MRTVKIARDTLISNVTFLFAVMFFLVVLFGYNPDITENSLIHKNMVLPYIPVNLTFILTTISFVAIVAILLCKKSRFDKAMIILLFRIPLYFIPFLYLKGDFKIGVAYSIVQCFFAYFIGSQYRDNFRKIEKLIIFVSISICIEVFAVLIINNISIFSLDLKWYMVIPMGKSNYISCFLLPIYCLVDNYWTDSKRILKYIYTIIIFVAILGTGSKLALILFLAYQGVKSLVLVKPSIKTIITYVLSLFIVIFALKKFETGVLSIVMRFTQNNIFENRLKVYEETFSMIFEHFFLGRSAYAYQVFDANKTHNFLLESLIQTGIIGTILFVYVLCITFRKLLNIKDLQVRKAMISFIVIYLIQGLAEPNMFGAISDAFFWLMVGLGCSFSQCEDKTLEGNEYNGLYVL